jgi:hypothetical protein
MAGMKEIKLELVKEKVDKPLTLFEKISEIPKFLLHHKTFNNPQVDDASKPDKPVEVGLDEANLISSIVYDDGETVIHNPVLDVDIPMWIVPSTNPFHYHLVIDRAMTPEDYDKLLNVLVEVGILEKGIYELQWKQQGATFIRPPWVKKTPMSGGSAKGFLMMDEDKLPEVLAVQIKPGKKETQMLENNVDPEAVEAFTGGLMKFAEAESLDGYVQLNNEVILSELLENLTVHMNRLIDMFVEQNKQSVALTKRLEALEALFEMDENNGTTAPW